MARPITITNDAHEFDILPTNKPTTYVYDSGILGPIDLTFNVEGGNSVVYRNGNDIVVITNFVDENNSQKLVTTTVKDYFKEGNIGSGKIIVGGVTFANDPENLSSSFREVVTDKVYDDTEEAKVLLNLSGSNTYNLTYAGTQENPLSENIWDMKGNDTYNLSSPHQNPRQDFITDFAGKDKYNLNETRANLTDYKGNDTYTSTKSALNVKDYAGNDKYDVKAGSTSITDHKGNDQYTITKFGETQATYTITDMKGNDKYNISNIDTAGNLRIIERGGNDQYNVQNVNGNLFSIEDYAGNDKYNLKDLTASSTEYMIRDYAGNDKYTFDSVYRTANAGLGYKVHDTMGNDKYEFKGNNGGAGLYVIDGLDTTNEGAYSDEQAAKYLSGKDKYTFDSTNNIMVTDRGGNNKFTVKNSDDISITAEATSRAEGKYNDSYTVSGTKGKNGAEDIYSTNIAINDKSGSDKYNLSYTDHATILNYNTSEKDKDKFNVSNSTNFTISSNGDNIDGNVGASTNETYNIKASTGTIHDYQGDETYKVSKLDGKLVIDDKGGTDSLILSDSNAKNLVFLADDSSCDLFVVDTYNYSLVRIKDYFAGDEGYSGYTFEEGHGDGYIETIKAGSKNVNSLIGDYNYFNEKIAAWKAIPDWGELTVEQVLNGDDAAAAAALIQLFAPQA